MDLRSGVVPDISEAYGGTLRLQSLSNLEVPLIKLSESASQNLENMPASFSLIGGLPDVEDQSLRGTCAAFAGTLAAQSILALDLSEQHAYNLAWNSENSPGSQIEGVSIEAVCNALYGGICEGPVWPYEPLPIDNNFPQNPVPRVVNESAKHAITRWGELQLPVSSRGEFLAAQLYSAQAPIIFSVPTFWNGSCGWEEGFLIELPFGEPPLGGWHALCAVGYDLPGRFIIVQNSWGTSWGFGGFGLMQFDYLERYMRAAFRIWSR
jgi:hypothetical protein